MRTVRINSRRGSFDMRPSVSTEQDRDAPARSASLPAAERMQGQNVERASLFGIEYLQHKHFSKDWNFPRYREGNSSCPGKGHLGV